MESNAMNLSWINRNRSLELSPRARLVDDIDAKVLERKRERLRGVHRMASERRAGRTPVARRTDRPGGLTRRLTLIAPVASRHHRVLDPARLVGEMGQAEPRMAQ
jgi:hypothetical protein